MVGIHSLSHAHEADLSGANLSMANGVSEDELEEQAKTLKGATMPDGSEHP